MKYLKLFEDFNNVKESDSYDKIAAGWKEHAEGKTKGFQDYIDFVIENGHLTPNASSVFGDWLDKSKPSKEDAKDAADELFTQPEDRKTLYQLIAK